MSEHDDSDERHEELGGDPGRTCEQPVRAGDVAEGDLLAGLRARAAAFDEGRRRLPCYQPAADGDLEAASAACEAVEAWRGEPDGNGQRGGCRWMLDDKFCARERLTGTLRAASEYLRSAGVPRLFAERVLASVPGSGRREALEDVETLRVVRAFLVAGQATAQMHDGARELFTGGEWGVVLAGPPGNGKSLAAAYAIARAGGVWIDARRLANPKMEIDAAERAPLLVVDDLGTEYSGTNAYATERAAALLELRYQDRRRTLVTTNLRRDDFAARYGPRLFDRLRDRAKFLELLSPSLRGRA
jgi:hypothetical protein